MEKSMLTPDEILSYTESVGIKKANQKFYKTFLLAILAGIFISMGAFSASIASHAVENMGIAKLVAGIVFPVGLMLVLICGAELFTGNSLLSIAYFEKKISTLQVLKNWTIVFFGNLIGAVTFTTALYFAGSFKPAVGVYAIKIAGTKAGLPFTTAFISGILCNVIVCLAVWGTYAAKDLLGKIIFSFFTIMIFVIMGFEHCVANMYYLTAGFIAKLDPTLSAGADLHKLETITPYNIVHNIVPVTLGNIVGGAIVVAGIYYLIYKDTLKK